MLTEVQQICTRVAIINHGKLITETSVNELLTGQGTYTVKVDQARQALTLVQQQPWGQSAKIDSSGALITPAPNGRGRELNLFLVQAGFIPDSLSQTTQDLVQNDLPPGVSLRDLGTHRLRHLLQPEHIYQLLHPELPADFPPLRSISILSHNLPQQVTRFVGREREM